MMHSVVVDFELFEVDKFDFIAVENSCKSCLLVFELDMVDCWKVVVGTKLKVRVSLLRRLRGLVVVALTWVKLIN